MINNRQYSIDLSGMMANFDANYIRLLKLMPDLESYRMACLAASEHVDFPCLFDENTRSVVRTSGRDDVQTEETAAFHAREFIISSPAAGDEELRIRIRVVEVFPYTSTVEIRQLNRVSHWIDPPGMLVRLYHDAATAEAVAYQGHRAVLAKYKIPNSKMYHQDEKRQINEFLGEWLSLCVQSGRSLHMPDFICAA